MNCKIITIVLIAFLMHRTVVALTKEYIGELIFEF